MSERKIAIGDIHGCANALEALISAIKPTADDQIICLGDLIDRGMSPGPEFKSILTRAQDLQLEGKLNSREEALALEGECVRPTRRRSSRTTHPHRS